MVFSHGSVTPPRLTVIIIPPTLAASRPRLASAPRWLSSADCRACPDRQSAAAVLIVDPEACSATNRVQGRLPQVDQARRANDNIAAMGFARDCDHQAHRFLGAAFWTHPHSSATCSQTIDIDLDSWSGHHDKPAAPDLGLNVQRRTGDHCFGEVELYRSAASEYLQPPGDNPRAVFLCVTALIVEPDNIFRFCRRRSEER